MLHHVFGLAASRLPPRAVAALAVGVVTPSLAATLVAASSRAVAAGAGRGATSARAV